MWYFQDAEVARQHSGHIDTLDVVFGNAIFSQHTFNHVMDCLLPWLIAAIYGRRFGTDCL